MSASVQVDLTRSVYVARWDLETSLPESSWPWLGTEAGFRFFGFNREGTPLEARLIELYRSVQIGSESAAAEWEQIVALCCQRKELPQVCQSAVVVAQPDEHHFLHIGMHSSQCDAHTMAMALVAEFLRLGTGISITSHL
ncbi:MAG TPA: hypothetical protein VGM37_00615 [Armatimonadota bacterium]